MLFHLRMDITLPHDLNTARREMLISAEKTHLMLDAGPTCAPV
jgi:hypothetical protein